MRRLCMFGGLFLACGGLFLTWVLYGFGTMMDPDVQGRRREIAIWRQAVGEPSFPVGILMIVLGGWLMLRNPKPSSGA